MKSKSIQTKLILSEKHHISNYDELQSITTCIILYNQQHTTSGRLYYLEQLYIFVKSHINQADHSLLIYDLDIGYQSHDEDDEDEETQLLVEHEFQ